jgi:hypothetical protein
MRRFGKFNQRLRIASAGITGSTCEEAAFRGLTSILVQK